MVTLCMAFFITLSGCAAYVGPGGSSVVVAPPVPTGVVVWGGGFDSRRNVRMYSNRGFQSRGAARRSGGRFR